MPAVDNRLYVAQSMDGRGVLCSAKGVSLAGVGLLNRRSGGFEPCAKRRLGALLKAAYSGEHIGLDRVHALLLRSAQALNEGDLARAMVWALQMRLPQLDEAGLQRLAEANQPLSRRIWFGWSRLRPASPEAAEGGFPVRADVVAALRRLRRALQRRYDFLGPYEFVEATNDFAQSLTGGGVEPSGPDRSKTVAEYIFLQDRLSFWLNHDCKSPKSHEALLKAAFQLFQAAIDAELIVADDASA